MKKYALLILIFISITASGQTTEEEYRYITKGYKIEKESGLDPKKGYKPIMLFKRATILNKMERSTFIYGLYKTDESGRPLNNTIPVALILELQSSNNPAPIYLCIPHTSSSEEISKKCMDDFMNVASQSRWNDSASIYSWDFLLALSKAYTSN